jgi:hypothetical protein
MEWIEEKKILNSRQKTKIPSGDKEHNFRGLSIESLPEILGCHLREIRIYFSGKGQLNVEESLNGRIGI